MHVYALINCPTDEPYWVSRHVFYEWFNQADFRNRKVSIVEKAYLKDWFGKTDDGKTMFYIPVVSAIRSRTDLVSSRHRLAVLLPHLDIVPFAFAFGQLCGEAETFLRSIPKRPLDINVPIWLPDLPVRDSLP